jgi:5-methylcytosine-specific restriction endonuclease McrA
MKQWKQIFNTIPDMGSLFSAKVYGGLSYTLIWDCGIAIESFVNGVSDMNVPITYPRDTCVKFYEMLKTELMAPQDTPSGGQSVGGSPTYAYGSIYPVKPDVPFKDISTDTPDILHDKHRSLLDNINTLNKFVQLVNDRGSSTKTGSLPKNASLRLTMMGGSYQITGSKASCTRLISSCKVGSNSWKNAKMNKVDGISGRGTCYILSGDTEFTFSENDTPIILGQLLRTITNMRTFIDDEVSTRWMKWTQHIRDTYEMFIREISEIIASVDVARSSAVAVHKMGYTWPTITSSTDSSWVKCEGLRHPLIESIRQDVPYVPHTISIGDCDDIPIGRLVFGVNSSGKSSLMKALGISVVLAQVGMPVPAKQMNISMYSSLFTRIHGNDDLFRGLSTFRVEADEIIRILKKSNHHSLVLGDELCSGTEQIGAESLVTASILTLLRRRCSFLFATHLHRVRDIPDLINHPRLGWNHLRVDVDKSGVMRMDRRLQEGAGPRGYAIDFVERMGGDMETMNDAKRIRDMITSEEFSILSSRAWTQSNERGFMNADENQTAWNPRAGIQSVCQICNSRPSEETDHIVPRETATHLGGLSGVGSVHSGGNLVGLCSKCHERKTRGEIVIHGYEEQFDPSVGGTVRKLLWNETEPEPENTRIQDDDDDDEDDSEMSYVQSTICRMSRFGKTPRQIQGFLRRNGHKLRLTEISTILGSQ